jgi:hypothetical protein
MNILEWREFFLKGISWLVDNGKDILVIMINDNKSKNPPIIYMHILPHPSVMRPN